MNTKLVINLREGVINAEGSEDFVRTIYADFKERMARPAVVPTIPPRLEQLGDADDAEEAAPLKAKRRKSTAPEGGKQKAGEYKPAFNSSLNLSGLEAFYDQYDPHGNAEKILIFAVYLRDTLNVSPCSADDIYTCYFTLKHKTKTPEAFLQAFRDAQHRTHFIEYHSHQQIEITIAGDNHFHQKLKKASAD